jgi:hypothetical protein
MPERHRPQPVDAQDECDAYLVDGMRIEGCRRTAGSRSGRPADLIGQRYQPNCVAEGLSSRARELCGILGGEADQAAW